MNAETWLLGRRGQALALGVTAVGFLLLWFGVVAPVRSWYVEQDDWLSQRRELLQHMRQVAGTLPALERSAAAHAPADSPADSLMLPGDSDALAAAGLQEQVQRIATASGASLTTVETLPGSAEGAWRRVSLRISLNAPWDVLVNLIRSVRQSPAAILVDDLHVKAPTAAHPTAAEPVQASMVLYGFRQGGAGSHR
jgi:type II secretory pathway component PulM